SVKMYADGALGSRGAALLQPYADDPENLGLIVTPQAHIEAVTERALRNGFQPCVHAIGDRANRMILDVYETALPRTGADAAARPRIEHAQVIAPEDIARFAQLGVIASVQAAHWASDMPWAPARLGAQRIGRAYPWRSLLDAGAIVANGSDAPVEPANTLRTFHASISHERESMTRPEALASMTIRAAYANFQDRVAGSLSAGKFADFVVMDRDWLEIARDEILQTKLVSTYFGGRQVFGA
ncbi:MAG: amidohydrolase family protein, partial [Candidatus Eremiobacteraeota bacterium]|nr:amidohydrolase family protein [Candidatus Eremiobacteraeota bacterium]